MPNLTPQAPILTAELREELFQIKRYLSLYQLQWMLQMMAGEDTFSMEGHSPPLQGFELKIQEDQQKLQELGLAKLDEWGDRWSLTENGLLATSLWMAELHSEIQAAILANAPLSSGTPT